MLKISTRANDHDKHAIDVSSLLFSKNKLYSAGDDGKIKMWEDDLSLVAEVQAHPSSVLSVAITEDRLYSCSNDGTVKAFTLDLKEEGVILQDQCEFWQLHFANDKLYIGDDQGVIRVFQHGKVYTLLNLVEPIKELVIVENMLYTARDLDVVISEIYPGDQGHYGTVATLVGRAPFCIAGNKICVSSREGKDIIVYENYKDHREVTRMKNAHSMVINSLCGRVYKGETLLFSGGWDKVVKQWKVTDDKLLLVNDIHLDMDVTVLVTGPVGEIYAAGSDGHIVRIDV